MVLESHWEAVLSMRLLMRTVPFPKPKDGPSLPFLLAFGLAPLAASCFAAFGAFAEPYSIKGHA